MNFIYEDLMDAKRHKTEIDSKIQSWIDIYEGKPYGNEVDGRSKMVWKLVKKHGEALAANITKPFITGNKIVQIEPRTRYDTIKASLDEKLLNYFFEKEFNKVKFLKTLRNVLIKEGTAFVKVSWIREDEEIDMENEYAQLSKLGGSKKVKIPKVNRPYAEVCYNEDIFTDPDATSLEDSRFFIHRYRTTPDELERNPEYDKEAVARFRRRVKEAKEADTGEELHGQTSSTMSDEEGYIYEYYDMFEKKVYSFLNSGNIVEVIQKKSFEIFPYVVIPLFDNEFSIWGRALADVIEDEQKFITSIIRGVIDNMSMSNNGTKFVKKGSLDAINYKRLMEGHPVVEINSNTPINQVVHDGSFNELPSSVYNMLQIIEQQSEGLTGVNRFMQGISSNELNSPVSNFRAMLSQAQIRLIDITVNLTNGLKEIFGLWLEMIYDNLSDEEIFKITGTSMAEEKTKMTKKLMMQYDVENLPPETQQKAVMLIVKEVEDIFNKKDSKYDININVGTDGLREAKIAQLNMFLQQASQLVQLGVVPQEAIKGLIGKLAELLEFPDVAHNIKTYKPEPDPMQAQMMQVQLQKELAEAKKAEALAMNAMARTKQTEVKAQKELASTDADIAKKYAEVMEKLKDDEE
jgi:hypothetical protein